MPAATAPAALVFAGGADGLISLDGGPHFTALAPGPAGVADPAAAVRHALANPVEFPGLDRAVIPDDRVAVALSEDLTHPAAVVAGVVGELKKGGVAAGAIDLVRAAGPCGGRHGGDPRGDLTRDDAAAVTFTRHDPEDEEACAYLASTAAGDRVYLARAAVEADVVVTCGALRYDPLLGVAGTYSVLMPGLSDEQAVRKARGQGHGELGPDDSRPLRQLGDEVGWLLGSLFSVQTVPAADGGTAAVLAGGADAVLRAGRARLNDMWTVRADRRADAVLVAVAPGSHDRWAATARALDAARRLVARGGRIVCLTDLAGSPPPGLAELAKADEPADVLAGLRQFRPPDLLAATAWANAARHARLVMLSGLDDALSDDLFAVPVAEPAEALRALADAETVAAIGGGQFVWAEVAES